MADLTVAVGPNGVAVLTIDTAGKPMNLATLQFGRELDEAVARIATDSEIKGAVITSAKADFMAGGDIHGMVASYDTLGTAAEVYHTIARPFTEVLRRLETSGKPYAAAINGTALGGGLELALACHFRVVADLPKLILGCPEVTIGLIPGAGGTQRLPRMLGIKSAVDLLLEGRRLLPAQAKARLGRVSVGSEQCKWSHTAKPRAKPDSTGSISGVKQPMMSLATVPGKIDHPFSLDCQPSV